MGWADSLPTRVEAIEAKSEDAVRLAHSGSAHDHRAIVMAINALTEAVLLVAVAVVKRSRR